MKIFLTGATGYIGNIVAQKLKASGHGVIGLARSDKSEQQLRSQEITVHRGNLQDPDSLSEGAKLADVVIHTAMPSPMEIQDFAEIGRIAAVAQQALFDGLKGTDKVLITTSGTGAYGDTGETLVDEDTPIPNDGPLQGFGKAEQMVLNSTKYEVRGMIIRPSIVYGNGGGGVAHSLIHGIRQAGYGAYVAGVDSHLSVVHVDDLADLYMLMLDQLPIGELFNAVSEIVAIKDIVKAAMIPADVTGELRAIEPHEAMQYGFVGQYMGRNMRVSAEKAKRVLGWQPTAPSILDDLRSGSYIQPQVT